MYKLVCTIILHSDTFMGKKGSRKIEICKSDYTAVSYIKCNNAIS